MSLGELRSLGFSVDRIYDDDLADFASFPDSEQVCFAFRGMCMGWSWALYLANEAVVEQCRIANSFGTVQEGDP